MSVAKDFLCSLVVKDITTPTAQYLIPWSTIRPSNPENFAYLPCGNSSAYPSIAVQGEKSPKLAVASYAKASWHTATHMNGLIGSVNSNGDTPYHAIGVYDTVAASFRVFDYCKCNQVDISGNANGGPQTIQMGFDGLFAVTDDSLSGTVNGNALTTLSSTGASTPDAGQATNVTTVTITGATKVRSYRITLIRGQLPQFYFSGNRSATEISTGMFSGLVSLEIEPAGTAPSSALTIVMGGVTYTMTLNLDEYSRVYNPSFGTATYTYSLINLSSGGNPCVIS